MSFKISSSLSFSAICRGEKALFSVGSTDFPELVHGESWKKKREKVGYAAAIVDFPICL